MAVLSSNVTIDEVVIDNLALYESIRKSLTRDPFFHYVNGICGLSICLLGIISNALSFSVLIRRTMNLSTYVYLAGLCLSDFATCLCLIPGYVLDAYPPDIPDSELPRTYLYTKVLIITGRIVCRNDDARNILLDFRGIEYDNSCFECVALCGFYNRSMDKFV